jgi:hypothetical protein
VVVEHRVNTVTTWPQRPWVSKVSHIPYSNSEIVNHVVVLYFMALHSD